MITLKKKTEYKAHNSTIVYASVDTRNTGMVDWEYNQYPPCQKGHTAPWYTCNMQ